MNNHIVVGVDSSAASLAALRWAYGHASAHGQDLTVIHVTDAANGAESNAQSQSRAQARTLAALPCLDSATRVTISASHGPLATSLGLAAEGADAVVIGVPQLAEHAHLLAELDRSCGVDVVQVDVHGKATAFSAGRQVSCLDSALR